MQRDLVNRRDLRQTFQPTPRSVLGNRPRPPGRRDEDPNGTCLPLYQDKLCVFGEKAG
jgi:hypothetical protein